MHLTIAYSKIKRRNQVLINNDTYQRKTLPERPIRQPLRAARPRTPFQGEYPRGYMLYLKIINNFMKNNIMHLIVNCQLNQSWSKQYFDCFDP